MILISLIAFAVHAIVVARSTHFFMAGVACRDADKAIVAAVGALSALYILSQVYTVISDPNALMTPRVSLRVGFDAAVAFLFYAVAHEKLDTVKCRVSQR